MMAGASMAMPACQNGTIQNSNFVASARLNAGERQACLADQKNTPTAPAIRLVQVTPTSSWTPA
jgi:hypothetical protein